MDAVQRNDSTALYRSLVELFMKIDPGCNALQLCGNEKHFGRLKASVPNVHLERAVAAHTVYAARRFNRPRCELSDEYESLGIVEISDFFDEDIVEKIRSMFGPSRAHGSLAKTPETMLIGDGHLNDMRIIRDYVLKTIVTTLAKCLRTDEGIIRRELENTTYFQHVVNESQDRDVQKILHQDTFFPAMKFWYFPWSVDVCDGPLVYVPGSNVLDVAREEWMLKQISEIMSGSAIPHERTYGHAEGSLRVFGSELKTLNPEFNAKKIAVRENTLVVANVFGFHARAEVTGAQRVRLAIHGSYRPIKPFEM